MSDVDDATGAGGPSRWPSPYPGRAVTPRVRVLCRKCGQLVFDVRDSTKPDGEVLLGYSWTTQELGGGPHWDAEQWCRESRRGELVFQCPRNGALGGLTWGDVFEALGQARRTERLVTLRIGKSR